MASVALFAFTSAALISCSGSYTSTPSTPGTSSGATNTSRPSRLAFRAFISNALAPTGTGSFFPVLNIIDTTADQLSFSTVQINSLTDAGLMVVSPNKLLTLVLSPQNHSVGIVDNSLESEGNATGTAASAAVNLTGPSESLAVGTDNATGYAAVPSASIVGSPPGAVEVFSLASASITATIPAAAARYVVLSHNGNRLLALGENSNTVSVIVPSAVGSNRTDIVTPVCCFDHPTWAIFSSDDTKAYIFNCGPECGGVAAGITVLDMNSAPVGPTIGATVAVPGGASFGMLNGNTIYAAGTPPGADCSGSSTTTAAKTCGRLSVVDIAGLRVTSSATIADGYHHAMELGSNGQLFIGGNNCVNVSTGGSSGETRGCLSIFNTTNGKVVVPPQLGDATGMQAIAKRNVVYVCQGGVFYIYDTTTDKLIANPPTLVGDVVDVKVVD